MRKMIDRILVRYGSEAVWTTGEISRNIRVFFQSVNSKSLHNIQWDYSQMGFIPGGQYVCILPADVIAQTGDTLTIKGKHYVICRLEPMPVCDKPLCWWALCTGKGDNLRWL